MPGPPPKPPSQRRRRNAIAAPVVLPAGKRKAKAPALPLRRVSAETRAWWRMIWASPMAHAWLEADVPGLVRLAGLMERAATGAAPLGVLTEIRNLEDRYGLSPMARRRLQWEVEQAGGGKQDEPRGDESRWLRAVSD